MTVCLSLSVFVARGSGGNVLVIQGTNFGANGSVMVGSRPCAPILAYTHTIIQCVVPEGDGLNASIIVSNEVVGVTPGQANPTPTATLYTAAVLRYYPPVVQAILPSRGPVQGGYLMEIIGSNFGTAGGQRVLVNGVPATTIVSSHRNVVISMPPCDSTPVVTVVVDANGQMSTSQSFVYDAPVLGTVLPAVVYNLAPTNLVLSGGTNFWVSSVPGYPAAQFQWTVWVGSILCTGANAVDVSTITCVLPAGQTVGVREVVLQVNGQNNTNASTAFVSFECAPGYFGALGEHCQPCPYGANCTGGLLVPASLPGYWMASPTSFVDCRPTVACSGNVNSTQVDQCSAAYSGDRCGMCRHGYYR